MFFSLFIYKLPILVKKQILWRSENQISIYFVWHRQR